MADDVSREPVEAAGCNSEADRMVLLYRASAIANGTYKPHYVTKQDVVAQEIQHG